MKAILVFSTLAALVAKSSASCFSEKLGYKCCKSTNVIAFEDKDGVWGIENGEWCGISGKDLKKRQWWGGSNPWDQGGQGGNQWGGQQGGNPWEQGGNPWGGQQGGNPWGGQQGGGNPWEQGGQGGNPWGGQQGGGNPWEQGGQGGNPWGGQQGGGNPWEQGGQQGGGNPWEQNNNNQGPPQGGNPWEQNNNGPSDNAPPATDNGNTAPPATDNGNTAPPTTDNGNTAPPATDNGNTTPPTTDNGNTNSAPQTGGGGGSYPYPLKNSAVPSKGCGKNGGAGNNGNFNFNWSGGTRSVFIDLPQNYDASKPYRLVFGMHCMGGSASNVRSEGYYGLKPLDTQGSTIFVAPEGNGQQMPWGEADYKLFDELLEKLKNDYCIDESRVFSTGFSYGSMFSNGLSWNHQKVLRGVAVYETAERNIYLPQHTGDGIGWMGVLGFDDNLCTPEMGRHARDIILEHNSEGGKAVQEKAEEAQPNGPHKCYDYKTVDEKFPVRWCTQSGGHLWDHKDPGQGQSWVPQATWEFINKF